MSSKAYPITELVAPGVHRVVPHAGPEKVRRMVDEVAGLEGDPAVSGRFIDIARIDQLGALEQLKGAVAAAQARITLEFERSQVAQQDEAIRQEREAGNSVRADRLETSRGRGIGDQVALARNCATSQGSAQLSFARAMGEMPHTLALLTRGQISEWVATKLVQETAILTLKDRLKVDVGLCATTLNTQTGEVHDPPVLGLTPRQAEGRARAAAQDLDPEAAVRRAAKAAGRRRVTIRATPDTMTYVTGLLPVKDGVSVIASLKSAAQSAKAQGDDRTVSQLMADLLVQRITGRAALGDGATADTGADEPADNGAGATADNETRDPDGTAPGAVATAGVPVHVGLVMSAATFTGDSDQPARTDDGTVIPAALARKWVHDPATPVSIRRLFTDPVTGQVTEVDPRRRHHSAADKAFIRDRDQTCRMPGCDRTIEDIDHPVRHADGGETTRTNGQGLCEGHNLAKEAPGWHTRIRDPRPSHHEIEIITPTGHTYRSKAPPALHGEAPSEPTYPRHDLAGEKDRGGERTGWPRDFTVRVPPLC